MEVQENALLVTPATELVSCSAYTLTLLETAKMADGNAIGQSQTVQFTTTSKPLDICDGSLIQENTVTFSGTYIDAANDTSAQAVLVLYDADGRIVRVEFGEEMQAGAFTLSVENPNAYTAKAFCVTMDFQQVIGDKPVLSYMRNLFLRKLWVCGILCLALSLPQIVLPSAAETAADVLYINDGSKTNMVEGAAAGLSAESVEAPYLGQESRCTFMEQLPH